jgi:hypothetical protein
LKPSNSKSSKGLEKNIFISWFHRAPPREKKASNPWLSAEPKLQTIEKQKKKKKKTKTKTKNRWSGCKPPLPSTKNRRENPTARVFSREREKGALSQIYHVIQIELDILVMPQRITKQ